MLQRTWGSLVSRETYVVKTVEDSWGWCLLLLLTATTAFQNARLQRIPEASVFPGTAPRRSRILPSAAGPLAFTCVVCLLAQTENGTCNLHLIDDPALALPSVPCSLWFSPVLPPALSRPAALALVGLAASQVPALGIRWAVAGWPAAAAVAAAAAALLHEWTGRDCSA
ncbi:hypothetical protein BC567DRAFT_1024 [Phyllosticta citribraziliensis]